MHRTTLLCIFLAGHCLARPSANNQKASTSTAFNSHYQEETKSYHSATSEVHHAEETRTHSKTSDLAASKTHNQRETQTHSKNSDSAASKTRHEEETRTSALAASKTRHEEETRTSGLAASKTRHEEETRTSALAASKTHNQRETMTYSQTSGFGTEGMKNHHHVSSHPIKSLSICEHLSEEIKCPGGTSIFVEDAFYGRKDKETCPHRSIKDTNCKANNSLEIVRGRCDHKESCILDANNEVFTDPCVATYKYLHVDYQCAPVSSHPKESLAICEHKSKEIKCPEGMTILVDDAIYGRKDRSICAIESVKDINCKANNSLEIVRERCDHKERCTLEANNKVFKTDPCVATYKYLLVDYQCLAVSSHPKESLAICEHQSKEIKCPEGTSIFVEDAIYGRKDKETCPHISIKDTNCRANNSLEIVRGRCDHKESCTLEANNKVFNTDPCAKTFKYLRVDYQCLPAGLCGGHSEKKEVSSESKSSGNKQQTSEGKSYSHNQQTTEGKYFREEEKTGSQSVSNKHQTTEGKSYEGKYSNQQQKTESKSVSNKHETTKGKYSNQQQTVGKSVSSHPKESLAICEHQSKEIKCPEGTSIFVEDAIYGRKDKETCPHISIKDTNCRANNSLEIVRGRCDHKESCTLEANNKVFNTDPCAKTFKYLRVDYQCLPVSSCPKESIAICEHQRKDIKCPEGTSIFVEDAIYGRKDKETCPHRSIKDTNCTASNSLEIVRGRCDNKQSCTLEADNKVFNTDPCATTYKYLRVDYQCLSAGRLCGGNSEKKEVSSESKSSGNKQQTTESKSSQSKQETTEGKSSYKQQTSKGKSGNKQQTSEDNSSGSKQKTTEGKSSENRQQITDSKSFSHTKQTTEIKSFIKKETTESKSFGNKEQATETKDSASGSSSSSSEGDADSSN